MNPMLEFMFLSSISRPATYLNRLEAFLRFDDIILRFSKIPCNEVIFCHY